MTKASENVFPKIQFSEETAPATPSTGEAVVYVKSDGKLYLKDDAGTETDLTSGGGGGGTIEGTKVSHSTTFSSTNSAFTTVPFDTDDVDDGGWHDTVTNNSRITVTNAGWVRITAAVEFPADATKMRAIRILKNGATEVGRATYIAHADAVQVVEIACQDKASASDYYEVEVFQATGGALTCNTLGLSRFTVTQTR